MPTVVLTVPMFYFLIILITPRINMPLSLVSYTYPQYPSTYRDNWFKTFDSLVDALSPLQYISTTCQ